MDININRTLEDLEKNLNDIVSAKAQVDMIVKSDTNVTKAFNESVSNFSKCVEQLKQISSDGIEGIISEAKSTLLSICDETSTKVNALNDLIRESVVVLAKSVDDPMASLSKREEEVLIRYVSCCDQFNKLLRSFVILKDDMESCVRYYQSVKFDDMFSVLNNSLSKLHEFLADKNRVSKKRFTCIICFGVLNLLCLLFLICFLLNHYL